MKLFDSNTVKLLDVTCKFLFMSIVFNKKSFFQEMQDDFALFWGEVWDESTSAQVRDGVLANGTFLSPVK